jgi:DNA-binding MarR family transcriptional regulator
VRIGFQKYPGKIMDSETRYAIIAKLFKKGPLTVKQMADEIGLASTTILRHAEILVSGEMIKEVEVPEEKKNFKREKFYDVTFPIWSLKDQKIMSPIYDKIGEETAEIVKKYLEDLRAKFEKTELREKGWKFEDPDIYWEIMSNSTCTITREVLENQGLKPFPEPTNKWGAKGQETDE